MGLKQNWVGGVGVKAMVLIAAGKRDKSNRTRFSAL